ncbi:hypothetical protein [Mammaliicoccus sciuri]|uniref:hypothetical protein n=1 Tax=Mammaliicoccus sciuri TaxID=1296 RepID=UPI001954C17B|nr:hypothetical protein [Mammaliicoccus sciuri]
MYIDGNMIVEYVQDSANGFKWSSLIAPALTFLIGVATVWATFINTKKSNDTVKQLEKENRTNNNEMLEKQNKFMRELKNKELNANIIAQSRIDWIQDVRKLTNEYISSGQNFMEYIYSYEYYTNNKDKEELVTQVNLRHTNFLMALNRLMMYFPEYESHENLYNGIKNKENEEIHYVIYEMYNELKDYADFVIKGGDKEKYAPKNNLSKDEFIREHFDKVQTFISIYLKKEWEKAKNMN